MCFELAVKSVNYLHMAETCGFSATGLYVYIDFFQKGSVKTTKYRVLWFACSDHMHVFSLLAAGFFSKGHWHKCLVIANANSGIGRVEKKARQGGMAVSAVPMSRPILL